MKKAITVLLGLFLGVSAILLSGCKPNTPPTVSIENGDTTVNTGTMMTFTANVIDPDTDQTQTIAWYVNDTLQTGETDTTFTLTTPMLLVQRTDTVKVTVTDAKGALGEDSVALTIVPAAWAFLPGTGDFTYSVDLGSTPREVYFIFTNTSTSDTTSLPSVTPQFTQRGVSPLPAQPRRDIAAPALSTAVIKDKPEISNFNNNPPDFGTRLPVSRSVMPAPPGPSLDAVNDTGTFYIDSKANTVDATCRASFSTDDGRTLNIWVADDCWTATGTKKNLIDQTMVDALGSEFLKNGTNNDIYNWVTNIFGAEWGSTPYSNLIGADNNITILLFDIDGDNSATGGTVGYFWGKDNYLSSSIDYSNQRIMFYIDAVMYANSLDDGGVTNTDTDGWQTTDYWPEEVFSTLAHEFQHMIHFYQKNVLQGVPSTDTWLNEMCSLEAEDLTADKIGVNGPRGYDYSDGSAGSPYITEGRLPLYNYYNDDPLIDWLDSNTTELLRDYSIAYAYGAFLARNYGGAGLFRDIVQNGYGDYQAVEYALSQRGYSDSFADTLRQWGVANLLSSSSATPKPCAYNGGTYFTSTVGTTTYDLGSINLYNYKDPVSGQTGPYLYTTSPVGYTSGQYKTSNTYYFAGTGLSGNKSWDISLPAGVYMTAVFK